MQAAGVCAASVRSTELLRRIEEPPMQAARNQGKRKTRLKSTTGAETMQPVFLDLTKNERVLWLSVIERAMHDATERRPSVRQAALDWLFGDQVDFPLICEMAGLECAYLRKTLAPLCVIQGACVSPRGQTPKTIMRENL
jgi:hypothetical protein